MANFELFSIDCSAISDLLYLVGVWGGKRKHFGGFHLFWFVFYLFVAKWLVSRRQNALFREFIHLNFRQHRLSVMRVSFMVLNYLKNVYFYSSTGEEILFDINGDAVALFDVINVQIFPHGDFKLVKVGKIDMRAYQNKITIDVNNILWNGNYIQIPSSVCSESCMLGYRKIIRKGQPICCFDCVPCSQGEIANTTGKCCLKCPEDHWSNRQQDQCIQKSIEFLAYDDFLGGSLAVAAILCFFITASVLLIFIKHRDTPIVKANNSGLSFLLLVTLKLCFLWSLTFIGAPVKLACVIRQTIFGIIFSVSISCILAKTITVVIAFKATDPNSKLRKWVGSVLPAYTILFCSAVQLILCTVWLMDAPPFPEQNTKSSVYKIIIECNEGKKEYFYLLLGYMGSLASICFVVAYLARKLPDSFNEARHITFSMLVFLSVWLSFIPAYVSTEGKYTVAVEIFAILTSSLGMLSCIFFGKCYIILLRPEANTKKHLMGKKG
ncbi:vomeronasal type-2 receptor 26-like [Protopterus annectens]|uniref:vomeronasal type-2 receptor 26-like n=1 Tax=Protopterus annectens TaxID=7888 RepID=UPI001CFBC627|nr:vomeronasal type-2 receptor 26-like [Protopterus annectens]